MTATHLIVDIGPIMERYRSKELQPLYKYLPIETIISTLLSVSYYIDYSQSLYDTIDHQIVRHSKYIDPVVLSERFSDSLEILELISEDMITDIDSHVKKYIDLPDDDYYLLVEWLDTTSVILEIKS